VRAYEELVVGSSPRLVDVGVASLEVLGLVANVTEGRRRPVRWSTRGVVVGVVAASLVACGTFGSQLDMNRVKQQIKGQVQSQAALLGGLVSDVGCPNQRSLKRGDRFTCTVTVVGFFSSPTSSTTTLLPPEVTIPTVPDSAGPDMVTFVATVTQVDSRGTISVETRRDGSQ
jgi:Domain of unknown function (DUF4333)